MKNVIKNIKNSKGFVSLESILVIGVIIVLAGVILYFFNGEANTITTESKAQTSDAIQKQSGAGELGLSSSGSTTTP